MSLSFHPTIERLSDLSPLVQLHCKQFQYAFLPLRLCCLTCPVHYRYFPVPPLSSFLSAPHGRRCYLTMLHGVSCLTPRVGPEGDAEQGEAAGLISTGSGLSVR
jgi:hypothetical protein